MSKGRTEIFNNIIFVRKVRNCVYVQKIRETNKKQKHKLQLSKEQTKRIQKNLSTEGKSKEKNGKQKSA